VGRGGGGGFGGVEEEDEILGIFVVADRSRWLAPLSALPRGRLLACLEA